MRYGDTAGFEQDPYNLDAWRFRDYVIMLVLLDTGIVYVNAPTIGAEIPLPFGGTKHTGNGYREAGKRGHAMVPLGWAMALVARLAASSAANNRT